MLSKCAVEAAHPVRFPPQHVNNNTTKDGTCKPRTYFQHIRHFERHHGTLSVTNMPADLVWTAGLEPATSPVRGESPTNWATSRLLPMISCYCPHDFVDIDDSALSCLPGSNRRPAAYEAAALPSELRQHTTLSSSSSVCYTTHRADANLTGGTLLMSWSVRLDSNQRPLDSRSSTLPCCATHGWSRMTVTLRRRWVTSPLLCF